MCEMQEELPVLVVTLIVQEILQGAGSILIQLVALRELMRELIAIYMIN